jgi:trans-aconitate 2-methyltransferase
VIDEVTSEPPFRGRVPPELRPAVETPAFYEERLAALGLRAEVWETVYEHLMPSADGIVEWLEGTALRPLLTVLSEAEARDLFGILRGRMRAAYPAGPAGVVFPFRRLFFVARRG